METEVQNTKELSTREKIDLFEAALLTAPQVPYILNHVFTPGMYSRELYMLAGTMWTSEYHKTEHQYVVLEGCVSVFTEKDGEVLITAPFKGVTKPGTKRVLFIHENTRWVTFHPTDVVPAGDSKEDIEEAVAKVKNAIIEEHENKFLNTKSKEVTL